MNPIESAGMLAKVLERQAAELREFVRVAQELADKQAQREKKMKKASAAQERALRKKEAALPTRRGRPPRLAVTMAAVLREAGEPLPTNEVWKQVCEVREYARSSICNYLSARPEFQRVQYGWVLARNG